MNNKRNSKTSAVILKLVIIAALAVLLLIGIYKCGRWLETQNSKPDIRGDSTQRIEYDDLIEYGGKQYRLRKDLTTILVMGIDTESENISEGSFRSGGQADFQRLIVVDRGNKQILQIEIDRDTMTEIAILGVLGNPAGTRQAQICLAYSFGDGGDESCKLASDAVSKLFMGIPVDLYCAVNLDGIAEINDFVGGIDVTLMDDFSHIDPEMQKGSTITLKGMQAEYYVRGRIGVGIGTNEARMKRQQDYIAKLIERAKELQNEDSSFAERFYDSMSPFMTTNIAKGRIINEINAARDFDRAEVCKINGIHKYGSDGYMQFIPDDNSISGLVLDIFYEEIK